MTTDDRVLKATLRWMQEARGDEDLHPASLDPAALELEHALLEKKPEKRTASHLAARPK